MPKESLYNKSTTTSTLKASKAIMDGQAPVKTTGSVNDPKVLEYLKTAQRVQRQRKLAPITSVTSRYGSPSKNIINRLSKDSGGQNGKYHWIWGTKDSGDHLASMGYEPVVEHGEQIQNSGKPLWKVPTEFYRVEVDATIERDRQQLRVKTRKDKQAVIERNPEANEDVSITRDGKDLLE